MPQAEHDIVMSLPVQYSAHCQQYYNDELNERCNRFRYTTFPMINPLGKLSIVQSFYPEHLYTLYDIFYVPSCTRMHMEL